MKKIQTDNHKDSAKRKAFLHINADNVVDLHAKFDPIQTKLYATLHTPHDKLPCFAGIIALLAVNGQCRLHEFDEFAVLFNKSVKLYGLNEIDTNDDNIVRSIYALFDVAYFDEQHAVVKANLNLQSNFQWWSNYIAMFINHEYIDLIFKTARLVKPTSLIL